MAKLDQAIPIYMYFGTDEKEKSLRRHGTFLALYLICFRKTKSQLKFKEREI